MRIDIKKALGGRFTDEGLYPAGKPGKEGPLRRISVLLPIAEEKGFNCYRALVYLNPVEGDIFEVAGVERFKALCICCGEDRSEPVEEMDEAAEKRLAEYLEAAT